MSVHNHQNSGQVDNITGNEPAVMDFIATDQVDFAGGFDESETEEVNEEQPLKQHYAFGLSIDPVTDLPKITTMGRGRIAQQILKKASEAGVRIEQDPEMVQRMFKPTTDQAIPTRTYQVIAEILTFIYQINEAYATEKAALCLKEKAEKAKPGKKQFQEQDKTAEEDYEDSFEESNDDDYMDESPEEKDADNNKDDTNE
jgi:flagellar biosynthesis protein